MTNTVSNVIPDETLDCAIQVESNGVPNAKAKTSSATGLGQFLKGTWLGTEQRPGMVRVHRPDLLAHYAESTILDMRTNPSLSIELLARFWEDNAHVIGNTSPGDLYLAHFLGAGTAMKVVRSPAEASVEPVVGSGPVKANPTILAGKTCRQVREWAAKRMLQSAGHGWIAQWYNPNDPLVQSSVKPQTDAEQDAAQDANDPPVKVDDDGPELPGWLKPSAPAIDARPDSGVAPLDTTPHGQVNDQIANVQTALVSMNYNEVGIINGAWGGGTKAGIAAFLNDRGRDDLPIDMSQPVLSEIAKAKLENFRRPISQERATIKPKELAAHNPTMLSTLRTKALAFWGMVSAGGVTAFNALSAYFHQIWDMTAPIRKGLDTVPGFVWVVLAGVGCALLYINAHRAEADTKDAFENRRLLR